MSGVFSATFRTLTMAQDFSLDEELICAVCRDIFVEPVTLPCGHNYCEECVNQLKHSHRTHGASAQHYTCPLCLAPCNIGMDLKKNIVLHNILEKYYRQRPTSHVCSVCKGQQKLPAEKSCLNCEESYCTLHIMPHFESSTLRQHILVNPTSNINKLCKSHGKELELYCQTDHTALCVYCMLPAEAKHTEGHSVIKLSDATQYLEDTCQMKLSGVKGSLAEIKECMSQIVDTSASSKKNLESQQEGCTSFLRRIKLFLDFEERAWQNRFSVDLVQQGMDLKHKSERLMKLRARLEEAQEGLQQAMAIQNPLLFLETLKNSDWGNIYERGFCRHIVEEVMEGNSRKPMASAKIMPLFEMLRKTFSGDDIKLNPLCAHPSLKLCVESGSLWLPGSTAPSAAPYCVLSQEGLSCGVHHWEVQVEDIPSWTVGISYAPAQGKRSRTVLGTDKTSWGLSYSHSRGDYCAQHGGYKFHFDYAEAAMPKRIGVFLDVESGILSFYHAKVPEHLHTFYCRLDAPVYAAFSIDQHPGGEGLKRMTVINPEKNQ